MLKTRTRRVLAAARADGQPHGHLARAARPPGQEQVRHVGAGDQEHEGGHAQ